MNTRHHPAPWALLLLVALAPTARRRTRSTTRTGSTRGRSLRRSAPWPSGRQRGGFEATYRGRDLAYRLVGSTPDKKVVAVKVAEDGRPIWSRTWTPTTMARVPRAAVAAVQAEALNSTRVPGFRPLRAASVELVRIEKGATETFFELTGAAAHPARARSRPRGWSAGLRSSWPTRSRRTAGRSSPRRPSRRRCAGRCWRPRRARHSRAGGTRSSLAGGSWSLRSESTGPGPVEVMVEVVAEPKAETRYVLAWVSTQIPPAEMAPEAQAKLRDDLPRLDELKGFRRDRVPPPRDARELARPGRLPCPGANGEGKRLRVFIGHNPSVEATEDRDAEPPPERDRKFAVLAAKFGIDDRWVDVTEQARGAVSGGRLIGQLAGLPDPAFGTHKVLVVAYTADGRVGLGLARDDQPLRLPSPGDGQATRTDTAAGLRDPGGPLRRRRDLVRRRRAPGREGRGGPAGARHPVERATRPRRRRPQGTRGRLRC